MSDDLIKEKIKEHDKRITKLEDLTSTLQTMDYRLGNVEGTIKGMDEKLDNALTSPNTEKAKKWEKLIDYIFYFFLACILGYIAIKLGIK